MGGGKGGGGGGQQAAAQDWTNTQEGWQRQTNANRPNINTPWGRQTWTDNGNDNWTQNIELSPEEQASLDSQQRVTMGRSEAAEGLLGQATAAFNKPFNWDAAPKAGSTEGMDPQGARDRAENALWQRQISKLEPELTQKEDARRTRLANMGIAPEGGSEAWNRADQSMSNSRNSAYQDAAWQSIIGGGAEATREQAMGIAGAQEQDRQRQAYISGEAQRRGMSLNELNALLTGQQVNMPGNMQGAPNATASSMGRSDFLGGAGQDKKAGTDWGSAVGGAASLAAMLSDRRLKSNIRRIGTHPRGVGIYAYDIFGSRQIGVMAQELLTVAPELVVQHPSGYLMVNYGGL
jgi:hypothetical protein